MRVVQAGETGLEQEQLATGGRTPTAMEGVFGLVDRHALVRRMPFGDH